MKVQYSAAATHFLRNWEASEDMVMLCFPSCILQREWSVPLCSLVQWCGMLLSCRSAQAALAWGWTTTLSVLCCVPTLLPTGYRVCMAGWSTLALRWGPLITAPLCTGLCGGDNTSLLFLLSLQANTKQGVGRRGGIMTRAERGILHFSHNLKKH